MLARFQDENADLVERREAPWLVKGLWPRVGVGFVAGPSGSGKSFWTLDQASRIAKGQYVLGHRSVKSGTVYIAAEGANGVRARIVGLREHAGRWDGRIRFIADAPNLLDHADVEHLAGALQRIRHEMEECGERLGLVVVDTLSASSPGADENAGEDMGKILQALHGLSTSLEAFVLAVAHTGKDFERGIRGWSGQHANADAVILFYLPNESEERGGFVAKVKDGESGDKFGFALEVVDLGLDQDGDRISTCVVGERPAPSPRSKKQKLKGQGAQAEMILDVFRRLENQLEDISHVAGVVQGTKGVNLKTLRSEVFDADFHGETQPEDDDKKETEKWKTARRKAFQRAILKLQENRLIKSGGGYVWVSAE